MAAKVNTFTITNPSLIASTADAAAQRVALEIVRDAKRLAPRSSMQPAPKKPGPVTGNLKNMIAVQPGSAKGERRVVSPVHYGIYHEFGTRRMMARPFLGPALEAARRKYGA